MAPIGNTSMIYGLAGSLNDLVDPSLSTKLNLLFIDQMSILPGIGLGILISVVIYIYLNRSGKRGKLADTVVKITDDLIDQVTSDEKNTAEDSNKEVDNNE